MFGFILVSILLVGAHGTPASNNAAVDKLFKKANALLESTGHNTLILNDIDKDFAYYFYGKKLEGKLSASGGVLKGLATVQRVGDVEVVPKGSNSKLTAVFTYKSFSFNYDFYKFKYLNMEKDGGIQLELPEIRGTIKIIVKSKGSECTAEVQDAQIYLLGEPKLKFSASQIPQQFRSDVQTWILESFEEFDSVKLPLLDSLRKSLDKKDFCNVQ